MPKTTLKGLLPQGLRKDLTPAEEILLDKAQKGEPADFRSGDEETDKPENADNWGDDRRIRADLLYWLCVDREATQRVHAKGVEIHGAQVEGRLDFEAATLPHPLWLVDCAIPEEIILRDAQTRTIMLSGSHTGPITADGLTTQGSVFLRGTQAKGVVRLLGANIGANLDCTGATFENPEGKALSADGLTTQGNVFLRNGFQAKGEVRLSGAKIRGSLECDGATFENPKGTALFAEGLLVKGALFWRSMKERPVGAINLIDAKVGQLIDDTKSWPQEGKLQLMGFEYDAFTGDSPHMATERLRWLALQAEKPFYLQPYEQLAKVFRQMGREVDARKVLIGVELKHIAGFFDLPMILKRFGPLTARDALRVDSIVGLLHNHMPASERQKRLWLRAIWIGANRVELPDDAVPPFIRWIARNALNLGKTLDEVLSPLVDIKDWVAASYKSPRNPNWAYFKSTAKSDTLGERCVVTRPFDEHMSLSTVLNLSEEWHHAVAEADLEGENCAFPTPWYAASKMGNFEIVPLEQKAELYLEGKTMHHCVTTYSEQVQAGDCYFYSVRKGDKKIATVELNAPNHNVQLAQLRGPCNQKVSKDVDKAVHRWFAQCKRKHGNGNYMSRLRLVTTRNVLDADDIPF